LNEQGNLLEICTKLMAQQHSLIARQGTLIIEC
jgi:hypothetical protein